MRDRLQVGTTGASASREDYPCYTLKIRSGCEGGGKGPLIQTNKSATLSCNNDQYLFVPKKCFNQVSQSAVYKEDTKSVSLTCCGGSYGGGSECLVIDERK